MPEETPLEERVEKARAFFKAGRTALFYGAWYDGVVNLRQAASLDKHDISALLELARFTRSMEYSVRRHLIANKITLPEGWVVANENITLQYFDVFEKEVFDKFDKDLPEEARAVLKQQVNLLKTQPGTLQNSGVYVSGVLSRIFGLPGRYELIRLGTSLHGV